MSRVKQYYRFVSKPSRLEFHTGRDRQTVMYGSSLNCALNLEHVTAQHVAEWVDNCLYEAEIYEMSHARGTGE